MDSIVRWYIERALEDANPDWALYQDEFVDHLERFTDSIMEERENMSMVDILLHALELAVKDVG